MLKYCHYRKHAELTDRNNMGFVSYLDLEKFLNNTFMTSISASSPNSWRCKISYPESLHESHSSFLRRANQAHSDWAIHIGIVAKLCYYSFHVSCYMNTHRSQKKYFTMDNHIFFFRIGPTLTNIYFWKCRKAAWLFYFTHKWLTWERGANGKLVSLSLVCMFCRTSREFECPQSRRLKNTFICHWFIGMNWVPSCNPVPRSP